MKEYMVNIGLPENSPEEFFSLIPKQRARIDELMKQGVVTSYSLAFDRSRLWVTLSADSEEDVEAIVASFPLFGWMNVEIQELVFRKTEAVMMPPVSMN